MNNKQLEEYIKRINKIHHRDELTVAIPVQESWVGQRVAVSVNAIAKGIDWDSNVLFINPEKPLQYANRHELYQDDLDKLEEYKKSANMMKHYNQSQETLIKKAKDLLNKTDMSKLTSQQLKDLINILEFVSEDK